MIYAMGYRTPDPGNPRVQSTRDRILAAARELLAETGPAGLTYSLLADRAGVTRQTLYRHWPAKSGLLVDLILEGSDGGYPEPGTDAAVVAAEWLASLREGMRDPARRAAVLAVTAQADTDPDSAQALAQLMADRLAALNDLLKPPASRSAPRSTPCCTVRCWPGSPSSARRSPTLSSRGWWTAGSPPGRRAR